MKKPTARKAIKRKRTGKREVTKYHGPHAMILKAKVKHMTKPKEWPYQAAEARDRSAEEAQAIAKQAAESMEMTNDPGLLKKIGRILVSANTILRHMESQGAKTRPL